MTTQTRKNLLYSLILVLLVLGVYLFRSLINQEPTLRESRTAEGLVVLEGDFLGDSFLVLYPPLSSSLSSSIDSIFTHHAQQVLLASPRTELSRLNVQDSLINPSSEFVALLRSALNQAQKAEMAWDPSSKDLYGVWSFSSTKATLQDSTDLPGMLSRMAMKGLVVTDTLIYKTDPRLKLDLSDFGKTIALDQVAQYLDLKGVGHYFIQLGRHTKAKGLNEKKELWKLTFIHPDSTEKKQEGLIALDHMSVATSGLYTDYYLQDSLKKPKLLDPRTAYPVTHGLLSASIFAKSSKEAGILSEMLWVEGWYKAMQLDSARSDVSMILIFNKKGEKVSLYASPELRKYLSFPIY